MVKKVETTSKILKRISKSMSKCTLENHYKDQWNREIRREKKKVRNRRAYL